MLFKFAWTHTPEARDETVKKFMATGGMPPEGVEFISRYHNVDGTGGFVYIFIEQAHSNEIAYINKCSSLIITPTFDWNLGQS